MTELLRPYHIPPAAGVTSAFLSDAVDELFENQTTMNAQAAQLSLQLAKMEERINLQLFALTQRMSSLALANTAQGSTLYLDAYDFGNAILTHSGTRHLPEYGMIVPLTSTTLPENQFIVTDVRGQALVPQDTKLEWRLSEGATPWSPGTTPDQAYRDQITSAFDGYGHTAFDVDLAGGFDVYIRATLPRDYMLDGLTNAIALHAEPFFLGKILRAQYQSRSTVYDLNAVSVGWPSTLPATGVESVPSLFILPPQPISWVEFHLRLDQAQNHFYAAWLSHLGAYHLPWNAAGTVVFDLAPVLPSGRVLTGVTANEGDPDEFALAFTDTTATATLTTSAVTGVPTVLRTLACTYA